VPGCGFGHDVRAWAESGFAATGFDLSPTAIAAARAATPSAMPARYDSTDFLEQAPPTPFAWLFEHTLYCAIPRERRDDYARAAARWLEPGGQFLAVHYLLPPDDPDGPPFGCTEWEIAARFAPYFDLISTWQPRSWPHREGLEKCFWWRRR